MNKNETTVERREGLPRGPHGASTVLSKRSGCEEWQPDREMRSSGCGDPARSDIAIEPMPQVPSSPGVTPAMLHHATAMLHPPGPALRPPAPMFHPPPPM